MDAAFSDTQSVSPDGGGGGGGGRGRQLLADSITLSHCAFTRVSISRRLESGGFTVSSGSVCVCVCVILVVL